MVRSTAIKYCFAFQSAHAVAPESLTTDLPILSTCTGQSNSRKHHGFRQEKVTALIALVSILSALLQDEHPDRLDDANMPLELSGMSNRSLHSSGISRCNSLKDSSDSNLRMADRRRSSSYGRVRIH
jgi:hypothetical protein